jgi:hypothetical protein
MGLINWSDKAPSWEPEPEPEFSDPLDYLEWFYRQPDKPDRLRLQAAMELSKFRYPTLKAIAQVSKDDFATAIEAARLRSNVIKLQIVPKAIEHDAAELKPDPSRSPAAQSPGFKRRF